MLKKYDEFLLQEIKLIEIKFDDKEKKYVILDGKKRKSKGNREKENLKKRKKCINKCLLSISTKRKNILYPE
jgi:hypothetical protein